jgi:hypothetical protein
VDWADGEVLDVLPGDLESTPAADATFEPLPKAAAVAKNYAGWQKSFSTWLAANQKLDLRRHVGTGLVSKPGESDRDFSIRIQTAQREARDAEVDKIRRQYAEKRARLQEKIRRAEQTVGREQSQVAQQGLQTAISIGAAVLGMFGSRKATATSIGRATTAARGIGRGAKEYQDVSRAKENASELQQQLNDLDAKIAEDTAGVTARYDAEVTNVEKLSLAPKRGQIAVQFVALGWK